MELIKAEDLPGGSIEQRVPIEAMLDILAIVEPASTEIEL